MQHQAKLNNTKYQAQLSNIKQVMLRKRTYHFTTFKSIEQHQAALGNFRQHETVLNSIKQRETMLKDLEHH